VNADGVPVALAAYGNGKVPASALAEVGSTGHRLWAPAAESLERLIADAAKDGVTIGITDSYRSYESQVDVAERKGLYSQGGLAAVPGTSDHGWGMAVDLKLDDAAQSWMRTNAGRYGFAEDTPREPWHWAYQV
jgi:LAS superfamily LD-carboxypeptidase LdcB